MANACRVCGHPEVHAINAALVAGTSAREVAERYGLSKSGVARHEDAHLPATLVKAQAAAEVAAADDLLGQVQALDREALLLLQEAKQKGLILPALAAIRESRQNIELKGKLAGELQDGNTINVFVNVQWLTTRAVILQALLPFPEAAAAVVAALKEAESAGTGS